MPVDSFRTVGDDLLHVAAAAELFFQNQGYVVHPEQRDIGFPFTPTLVCKRGHETLIVEVSSSIDKARIERWVRFCRSQTEHTGLSVVIRQSEPMDPRNLGFVRQRKVGLILHDDQSAVAVMTSTDLAVHIDLPELSDLGEALRPILGPAFQKVSEGDWRDGLSQAYSELEQLSRDYLKAGIQGGRLSVVVRRRRQQVSLSPSEVDTMTLGQLGNAFASIQGQTYRDALIGTTIRMINQTRVGLAHRRRSASVEASLRQNVGQHMYAVINCLEELMV